MDTVLYALRNNMLYVVDTVLYALRNNMLYVGYCTLCFKKQYVVCWILYSML